MECKAGFQNKLAFDTSQTIWWSACAVNIFARLFDVMSWDNRNGWLGVKHQITYLLIVWHEKLCTLVQLEHEQWPWQPGASRIGQTI